jgi:hypothetical protein
MWDGLSVCTSARASASPADTTSSFLSAAAPGPPKTGQWRNRTPADCAFSVSSSASQQFQGLCQERQVEHRTGAVQGKGQAGSIESFVFHINEAKYLDKSGAKSCAVVIVPKAAHCKHLLDASVSYGQAIILCRQNVSAGLTSI